MERKWTADAAFRFVFGLLVGFCLVAMVGCGERKNKNPVAGTVTIDQEPVKSGSIRIIPDPKANKGSGCSLAITDGKFESSQSTIVTAGDNLVTVTARFEDGSILMFEMRRQIAKGGDTALNFDLDSEKAKRAGPQ